ncbi:uncharacterized protein LOC141630713 [Silene latifolia]|uniref:uncharacterized protein LOC141630713 n=1 Tax=Silene latifolia TaxID=37657 RepID=UPI003D77AC5F
MALCLRYVDKRGAVVERFLGIVHVGNTTSLTLKAAIQQLLLENSLTLSSVRGQGYDGASNMRGSINGLKSLIMNESPCAYYVHCFAHQLQLTLIAVAKKNVDCSELFDSLAILLNVIASSPKRKEIFRDKQAEHLEKALQMGEVASGSGLNQEKGLNRPGDTRWGSHFKTILSVFSSFSIVLDVLEAIGDFCDGTELVKVEKLAHTMRTFDFVFIGQLMITILGITNELNLALQKKNQDIVNAMALVDVTKKNLQKIRDDGWDTHMEKVKSFCDKYDIFVPIMSDIYVAPGRYKRGRKEVDNDEHFRIDIFLCVIDQILHEINKFLMSKLLRLAHYYPSEFSKADLLHFEYQLKNYFEDIRHDERFWNLKNLNELSIKLVETKKHLIHSKVKDYLVHFVGSANRAEELLASCSSSGKLEVGCLYELMRTKAAVVAWGRTIHDPAVIPKQTVFGAMACLNKLPTVDNRKKRGMSMANRCVLCEAAEEDVKHLFFYCYYSKQVWDVVTSRMGSWNCLLIGSPGEMGDG